jgi:hypothetical protein
VTKVRLFVPATCTLPCIKVPISLAIQVQYGKLQKPEAHITVRITVWCGETGFSKSPMHHSTMHDQKCMKSCSGLHLDFKLRDPTPRSKPPVSRLSLVRDCLLSAFHVLGTVLSCRQKGCVAGAFASELFMRLHRSSLNLGDDMSRNDPRTLLRSVARNVPLWSISMHERSFVSNNRCRTPPWPLAGVREWSCCARKEELLCGSFLLSQMSFDDDCLAMSYTRYSTWALSFNFVA